MCSCICFLGFLCFHCYRYQTLKQDHLSVVCSFRSQINIVKCTVFKRHGLTFRVFHMPDGSNRVATPDLMMVWGVDNVSASHFPPKAFAENVGCRHCAETSHQEVGHARAGGSQSQVPEGEACGDDRPANRQRKPEDCRQGTLQPKIWLLAELIFRSLGSANEHCGLGGSRAPLPGDRDGTRELPPLPLVLSAHGL